MSSTPVIIVLIIVAITILFSMTYYYDQEISIAPSVNWIIQGGPACPWGPQDAYRDECLKHGRPQSLDRGPKGSAIWNLNGPLIETILVEDTDRRRDSPYPHFLATTYCFKTGDNHGAFMAYFDKHGAPLDGEVSIDQKRLFISGPYRGYILVAFKLLWEAVSNDRPFDYEAFIATEAKVRYSSTTEATLAESFGLPRGVLPPLNPLGSVLQTPAA